MPKVAVSKKNPPIKSNSLQIDSAHSLSQAPGQKIAKKEKGHTVKGRHLTKRPMGIQGMLAAIMARLTGVNKWQRDFVAAVSTVLFGRQEKAAFENLAWQAVSIAASSKIKNPEL